MAYITRLVTGVNEHAAELDGYIAKYAKNWKFSRIPLVASAIMRVAMYEILYMPDIPHGASINEAVEIAKKYETPETVKFINGILGSFAPGRDLPVSISSGTGRAERHRPPPFCFFHTPWNSATGGSTCSDDRHVDGGHSPYSE